LESYNSGSVGFRPRPEEHCFRVRYRCTMSSTNDENILIKTSFSSCYGLSVYSSAPMNVSNTYPKLSSKAFTLRPRAAPLKISTATIIENPPLLVFQDKDVISSKRPAKCGEREEEKVRHNTSANPAMLRRGSRARSLRRTDKRSM
jgi:hypothetical protein